MMKTLRTLYQKSPLAMKVTFNVILVSSLITFIAILMLLSREYRLGREALEQRFEQIQQTSINRLSHELWNFDLDALNFHLDELVSRQDIASASISWRNWNDEINRLHRQNAPQLSQSMLISRVFPINFTRRDGAVEELGLLEISVNQQAVMDRLWQQFLFIILFQSLKTLLMAAAMIWIINWLIVRHLKKISRFTNTLQLANLYHPLELDRKENTPDELTSISSAINNMRTQLVSEINERQQSLMALESEKSRATEFQNARDKLEESVRYRKHFVTNISHEIRTPMNGIIGVIDLFSSTPLSDTQRHYLELMQLSSISLLSILNDILDYSKIEAGEFRLESAPVDMQKVAEESIKSFAATAFNRNLTLTIETRLNAKRYLKTDGKRIKQILLNLINNAIKFTSSGTISLTVHENTSLLPSGIRIEVQDTGIGIPVAEQKTIFMPFRQSGNAQAPSGSGLGLALCKKLVTLMGGKIGVSSQPGQGACFWLELDLPENNQVRETTENRDQKALILSPSTAELQALKGALAFSGFQVVASQDLSHLKLAEQFSLILMDSNLYLSLDDPMRHSLQQKQRTLLLLADLNQSVDNQTLLMRPVTLSQIQQHLEQFDPQGADSYLTEVSRFDHLNILVAEDNQINQDVICAILNSLRIQPIICANGEEVTAAYRAAGGAVDLVLMDCEMPVMDGFEATRQIRALERECNLPHTPIVALTAHVLPEHRDRMEEAGMDHFLSKPVRKDAVQRLLQTLKLEKRLQIHHNPNNKQQS